MVAKQDPRHDVASWRVAVRLAAPRPDLGRWLAQPAHLVGDHGASEAFELEAADQHRPLSRRQVLERLEPDATVGSVAHQHKLAAAAS
jgi:hypothetical protein